jgi:hypothetical protein
MAFRPEFTCKYIIPHIFILVGMRFGVIQCSNCKTARGIELDSKTAQCPRCGKKMNVKKARILSNVATEKELVWEVARLNVAIAEGEDIYARDLKAASEKQGKGSDRGEEKDVYDAIAGKLINTKGRDERIRAAAQELGSCLGEFTEEDYAKVLTRMGFKEDDDWRTYLAKLKSSDIIFEPKSGIYRCL